MWYNTLNNQWYTFLNGQVIPFNYNDVTVNKHQVNSIDRTLNEYNFMPRDQYISISNENYIEPPKNNNIFNIPTYYIPTYYILTYNISTPNEYDNNILPPNNEYDNNISTSNEYDNNIPIYEYDNNIPTYEYNNNIYQNKYDDNNISTNLVSTFNDINLETKLLKKHKKYKKKRKNKKNIIESPPIEQNIIESPSIEQNIIESNNIKYNNIELTNILELTNIIQSTNIKQPIKQNIINSWIHFINKIKNTHSYNSKILNALCLDIPSYLYN